MVVTDVVAAPIPTQTAMDGIVMEDTSPSTADAVRLGHAFNSIKCDSCDDCDCMDGLECPLS